MRRPALGKAQRWVLERLTCLGPWHPHRSTWGWASPSDTRKLLERLWARGLVERQPNKGYRINVRGRALLETGPKARAKRRAVEVIDGYVWCDKHGGIHEDTLDPYAYGEPESGFEDQRCTPEDHIPVYRALTRGR